MLDLLTRTLAGYGAGLLLIAALVCGSALYAARRIEREAQRRTLVTLRRSLDAVPAGMAFYDDQSRLLAWNAAFADIVQALGVTPREGMPRSVAFQAAFDAGWLEDKGAEASQLRGWKDRAAKDVMMPDGRWLRHQQYRLEGGGGVTKFTDITAERDMLRSLTSARDDAEAASRAKSSFLANISHEIRTPLNGMLTAAELLGRRPLDLEERELVTVLQTSGRLLNDLLCDLLDITRIESGAVELRRQPVEVAALVSDAQQLYGPLAAEKGLDLRVRLAPAADGWVSCDRTRVLQVLGNLLSNAIKFTDSGRVTLSVERHDSHVVFRVSDTGIGFTAGQKARLFERFFQADASSTRGRGGAGLGLAIAADLVGLMGGQLDCESAPGEGSTFMFTLDLPSIPCPSTAISQPAPVGSGRVLVVDDNEVNRRVLATILNASGIDHAEAVNGLEAVEAVSAECFKAVLMDIQMPVMDGLEATKRIRELERASGRGRTPIFVVSANGLQEHVDASLAAGADDHFGKPVSIPQLLGAIAGAPAQTARVA